MKKYLSILIIRKPYLRINDQKNRKYLNYLNQIKNLQQSSKVQLIICCLIIISCLKINTAYAMEHGEQALKIAQAISENHLDEAERLMTVLREGQLSETQLQRINDIINQAIQVRAPDSTYAVNHLELQNSGDVPQEPVNVRGILATIGIAVGIGISVYLIFRYWDDIRDTFFHGVRQAVPLAGHALRASILVRYPLVRNNPQVLHDIAAVVNVTEE